MPAIPTPPTLGYSFQNGLVSNYPAWPGQNLDQELTKAHTFAKDMVDVFAVAHQPNGQLKSATVSFDTLSSDALAQLQEYLNGPLGTSVYNSLVQYMRITAQGPQGYGVPLGGAPGQVPVRQDGLDEFGKPLIQWADPTVSWGNVTNAPATFPPSAHNQAISTIDGLQGALDGKAPTVNPRFKGNIQADAWDWPSQVILHNPGNNPDAVWGGSAIVLMTVSPDNQGGLGQTDSRGWSLLARSGNNPFEPGKFMFTYWNGSTWNEAFTIYNTGQAQFTNTPSVGAEPLALRSEAATLANNAAIVMAIALG